MNTWRDKAHRVIYALCRASYLQANTKKGGGLYKKHRPYAVPELAQDIIEALGNDDEERVKAIIMWRYN